MNKLIVGNITFGHAGTPVAPPDGVSPKQVMVYSSPLRLNLIKMETGMVETRVAGEGVCALLVEIFKKKGYDVVCEQGGYEGACINILPDRGKNGRCVFPFKSRKKETAFLKKHIYPLFDEFENISVDTPVGLTKP